MLNYISAVESTLRVTICNTLKMQYQHIHDNSLITVLSH